MQISHSSIPAYQAQATHLHFLIAQDEQNYHDQQKLTPFSSIANLLGSKIRKTKLNNALAILHDCQSWSELMITASEQCDSSLFMIHNIERVAAKNGFTVDQWVQKKLNKVTAAIIRPYLSTSILPSEDNFNKNTTEADFLLQYACLLNKGLTVECCDKWDDLEPDQFALFDSECYSFPDSHIKAEITASFATTAELQQHIYNHWRSLLTIQLLSIEECWTNDPIYRFTEKLM